MAQGAVGNVRHSKFLGSIDQAIRLVQCLKRRVLCLEGIDFGDCFQVSITTGSGNRSRKIFKLTRIGFAQSFLRAF